jgi:outer membrane biosynthesis protein TonB
MDLRIAPNGKVESAAMVKALPFGLDRAAHDAVMQWRFRSTESDEQPQSRCGRVSIKYDLGRRGRAQ